MSSVALATPQAESSTPAADPVGRFGQQVQVEQALAELERQVQRLLRTLSPAPPRPQRARRVRRARARRARGGYPAL